VCLLHPLFITGHELSQSACTVHTKHWFVVFVVESLTADLVLV